MFYGILEMAQPKTWDERIVAGCLARSTATTIFLPLVVIKTQIEWGSGNMGQVARHVYQTEGLSGFWRGLFPTLLRDGPYSGLYVLFYRRLQEEINATTARENFLCATAAGATATLLTQPADVLRCHLQIDQRKGFANFKKHLLDRGKLRALFLDGLAPRLTRRTMVSAINWTIFEEIRKRL